ncbi:hypothetical protein [Acetivibrio mesophilus]|uniref:Uncharacterized protein n=1 Tax=Acetivibrio mesophilus TaxID=2487273 RepID=A0A4Q0I6R4_9FIRM|nr:hypothetical protein [Acetivibrio mesophilus]ODM24973.1 hypothetical protein A7W90_01380 [Clostridium sp. Bc-iso-3]RXE60030.1 hypothetical protein EFD62_04550 [Acetivibrio mesophilus]HHV30034.1 hypothetical protein [Clostridium sp.]
MTGESEFIGIDVCFTEDALQRINFQSVTDVSAYLNDIFKDSIQELLVAGVYEEKSVNTDLL